MASRRLGYLLLFVTLALEASAFGTINEPAHIGQHSEHERLTRAALGCPQSLESDGVCFEQLSLMQLAGTSGPDGYVGQGFNGAVGAPDTLDPVPEGPEAHCDNADFLDSVGLGLESPYPQTREEATKKLQQCVNHLRERFEEGLDAADAMVDDFGRIDEAHVDLQRSHCTFSFPELHLQLFARSKCAAIEGFGRALHGIQDFYAHSNWADQALPPFGPSNPPGLQRNDSPSFLDLRAQNEIADQVPFHLSTGCFGGILTDGPVGQPGHPLEPGSSDCSGRITHFTLNKDNGIIDPYSGETRSPGPNTPRSNIAGNFQRAVSSAIKDTRRQWMYFREELRRTYGAERGNMMICSIVRDEPTKHCYGRRVAFITNSEHRRQDSPQIAHFHTPVVRWLEAELRGHEHNESEGLPNPEVDTTTTPSSIRRSGEMQIPLVQAAGGGFDTNSGPSLTTEDVGITEALNSLRNNLTKDDFEPRKAAVIALTTQDYAQAGSDLFSIWHAADYGIRVHLGVIPSNPNPIRTAHQEQHADMTGRSEQARAEDLMLAVLRTGGTYSTLHHKSNTRSFLAHVVSRGLTHLDNVRDTATLLPAGLTIADYVTPESAPRRFNFDASALHNAVVSVAPVSPRLALHVALRNVRKNAVVRGLSVGVGGNATFRAELGVDDVPRGDAWFELEIAPVENSGLVGSGLFEVSLETEDVEDVDEELPAEHLALQQEGF